MDFQYYKDVIDVASDNSKIIDFFQFVEKIHTLAHSKTSKCDIGTYMYYLEGFLSNPGKTFEDKREFFISHSIHFANVFRCKSNLKKGESYNLT